MKRQLSSYAAVGFCWNAQCRSKHALNFDPVLGRGGRCVSTLLAYNSHTTTDFNIVHNSLGNKTTSITYLSENCYFVGASTMSMGIFSFPGMNGSGLRYLPITWETWLIHLRCAGPWPAAKSSIRGQIYHLIKIGSFGTWPNLYWTERMTRMYFAFLFEFRRPWRVALLIVMQ